MKTQAQSQQSQAQAQTAPRPQDLEKQTSKVTPVQATAIFNWFALAFAGDNPDKDYADYVEGQEARICLETLSALFGISQDEVRQEYVNLL